MFDFYREALLSCSTLNFDFSFIFTFFVLCGSNALLIVVVGAISFKLKCVVKNVSKKHDKDKMYHHIHQ